MNINYVIPIFFSKNGIINKKNKFNIIRIIH